MQSQNTLNKLSRRSWLRNAAIGTTGAVVMPSLLTSCTDHIIPDPVVPGPGGVGATPPLTYDELYKAANNINSMYNWYEDLWTAEINPYITNVYFWLKGSKEVAPTDWKQILIDIFTDIGLAILQAAVASLPGVGPAIAITAKETQKWGLGKKASGGVDAAMGDFLAGYREMHDAVAGYLNNLAEPGDDNSYSALREALQNGSLDFNGKTYTHKELVDEEFPSTKEGGHTGKYCVLMDAASLQFKKHLWNAMFIKAGKMQINGWPDPSIDSPGSVTNYALNEFFPHYPDTYLRGKTQPGEGIWGPRYDFRYWYFTFDGLALSDTVLKELFMDEIPGHITNPSGLFSRDYVFKQFHQEKPDFGVTYDVVYTSSHAPQDQFDWNRDFEFTGGAFPQLIKK